MNAFQFAGQFTRYRSMADRSLQITFETAEATPGLLSNIQNSFQKSCIIAVSADNFTNEEIKQLENIKIDYGDGSKTPSQRIRSVLYILWSQDKEGYELFHDYYIAKTERYINHLKKQIL